MFPRGALLSPPWLRWVPAAVIARSVPGLAMGTGSVVTFDCMDVLNRLEVRILGLGVDGGQAVPAVARDVRELWRRDAVIEIETAQAGVDPRLATGTIRRWCDGGQVAVVFTVGRAGHDREDFAPEITGALLDRSLPGIEERMYLASARRPRDLLFRGRAGMRRATLVVNLPARPARARAIVRFLGPIVSHVIEKARGSDRECARSVAAR